MACNLYWCGFILFCIGLFARTEGKNIITVNGVESTIDVSPKIIDDRTYIPLRAFSENLGFTVNWDENTYEINIGV